jgi:hypothetical protein
MMNEVAERLRHIIDNHGPSAVAIYAGTKVVTNPTIGVLCSSFVDAIGSPMRFTSDTIDQAGKHVAKGCTASGWADRRPLTSRMPHSYWALTP